MKILVITTGGTIGSVFDGSSIDVSSAESAAVVEMYRAGHPDVEFTVQSPINILSESITAEDFSTLARVILTADYSPYDGVIFLSGSDNLGYISAFIGLLTADWNIPVTVVATDKVLTDPTANGYPNFCCAIELIRGGEPMCCVPYRNSDGVMYIHSATDIRQSDQSPDFYSFGGAYAVYDGVGIIPHRNFIKQTVPVVFDSENLPEITDSIALIYPYPMLDYGCINVGSKRAVLHTLYHSATLDSDRTIEWMKRLTDVPVYLASFRTGRNRYKTAVDMIAAGAIPLSDISPECAYAKLLLAAAQDRMSIREFMVK